MLKFRLGSRKAGQPVRALVEKVAGVASDPCPFDVFPLQEFIDLLYQVEVLEWGAFGR